MTRQVYGAKDLQELLGVSESKAYQYIRIMNAELQEKGFLTVRGGEGISDRKGQGSGGLCKRAFLFRGDNG